MTNERVLVRSKERDDVTAPLMRYRGKSGVMGRLRLSEGLSYRVLALSACGTIRVRVYDSGDVRRFADCEYPNLRAFVMEWGE